MAHRRASTSAADTGPAGGRVVPDVLLPNVSPFRDLRPEHLRQLRRALELVELPEGHSLYHRGTTVREVAFVLHGCLASAPPRAALYGPGDPIDVPTALLGAPRPATVITMRPSTLAIMERRHFIAALDDCPRFAASVLRQLARAARHGTETS